MGRMDGPYPLDCYECSAKNIEKNIEEQRQVVKKYCFGCFWRRWLPSTAQQGLLARFSTGKENFEDKQSEKRKALKAKFGGTIEV